MQLNINELRTLKGKAKREYARRLLDLDEDAAEVLTSDWSFFARPDQLEPEPPWQFWLFLAGRGAGKTRAGAEWVRRKIKGGCHRIALIAPTTADARDVMVEGQSGLIEVCWDYDRDDRGRFLGRPIYEATRRRVIWANGAIATTFSAEEPDRLRGPQHDALWADELAAWYRPRTHQSLGDAWAMAMFGLRVGVNPQAMISTTPRPIPIIRELIALPSCKVTTATTYDNSGNLAPSFFNRIITKYEGTRLGRQELRGELLEEAEGALWSLDMVEKARDGRQSSYARIVVAIDPAVTAAATSNLTGIVVAALGHDRRGYVLADLSGRYSPDGWARVAVNACDQYGADRVVAEGNQGGDLVRHTLATVRRNLPISIVHASRSKQARAEPVAALYEQRRITHCGTFPELETQLCTWEPLSGDASPDRLDALVWAFTDLMLRAQQPPIVMPFYTGTTRNIPGQRSEVIF